MSLGMDDTQAVLTVVVLTVITVVTRSFFFLTQKEFTLPTWAVRGLRYAPLAALTAVIAPEVFMSQGQLIHTWQDPRLFSVLAGGLYYFFRRGILGTILAGMAVFLPLRWVWGA